MLISGRGSREDERRQGLSERLRVPSEPPLPVVGADADAAREVYDAGRVTPRMLRL